MKLALLAILFVPVLAFAENSVPEQPEPAKVVSELIVGRQIVTTYYNEVTEQVCTYSESQAPAAPALTCAPVRDLSDKAMRNVKERAASIR